MSVHKDASTGNWFYTFRYADPFGKTHVRKKRGYKTKREAQRAEAKARETVHLEPGKIKLSELYDDFLAHNRRISDSTKYLYSQYWKDAIAPYIGDMYIGDIKPTTVDLWIDEISQKHAMSTVHQEKGFLSCLFNYGKKKGYCADNPAVRVDSIVVKKTERPYWEPEEFERFIKFVSADNQLIFYVLFLTGCRVGELCALQWKDVEPYRIHITKTVRKSSDGDTVLGEKPKTNNSLRWISIPVELYDALMEFKEQKEDLDGFNDSFFVFGDADFWIPQKIRYIMDAAVKQSGVKKITVHGLRHSHASFLIAAGIPDVAIAKRLGHTVDQLNRTYAHVYSSLDDRVYDVVNTLPKPDCCQSVAKNK